ncbi:hypothetical protein VTI74DRAFT_10318 [Chaetomium olivicolor]
MEQNLNCNVQECGTQLTGQAVVTVCSHAICLRCANNHGFAGPAPYTCPVCRQPLNTSEVCEQLLHPSEDWKSVALCGLSPTVVMECAGRALSFWSYQMTNQIKLKDYCSELQGEINNIWAQANQRISTLTTKIRDMEHEEHALRRKCEDLRLTLENRTRELSQSQELYSKLKQRVLLSQTQEIAPSIARSQTPVQRVVTADIGHGNTQSQLPRPVMPVGAKAGVSDYFPVSPGYSKSQTAPAALVESNKPSFSHNVPETPSSSLPSRNTRTFAFASTPRTGVGRALSVPGSGRFHQSAGGTQVPAVDGSRGVSGTRIGVAGLKRPFGAGELDISRPLLGRSEGPSRVSPQATTRQTSQQFEAPGPIIRRP